MFHDGHENLIRLLVWSGVALALLGLFYKIVGRGGIHEEAFQDDWGHVVRPAKSASASPPARPKMPAVAAVPDREGTIAFGLSLAWVQPTEPGSAHLACKGEPMAGERARDGGCNPYQGDTSCRTVLPVACYRPSGAPPSASASRGASGDLGATTPVMGALLKSESSASARCEAELGAGWRMAELHDGEGWNLRGRSGDGLRPDTRYWVHVNDQPGNCWNSPP